MQHPWKKQAVFCTSTINAVFLKDTLVQGQQQTSESCLCVCVCVCVCVRGYSSRPLTRRLAVWSQLICMWSDVSFGKILNPELPLIEKVLPTDALYECVWTVKCFEWSSRLEKCCINTEHLPSTLVLSRAYTWFGPECCSSLLFSSFAKSCYRELCKKKQFRKTHTIHNTSQTLFKRV